MPALNFQARFAPMVERGDKCQTIRAYRKDGRDPKVGDRLYLYTGMRTKACRKLGESDCVDVQPILISSGGSVCIGRLIGRCGEIVYVPRIEKTAFAKRDGFDSHGEMIEFFESTHGLPFEGLLIRWQGVER